jgi:prepilin-type N-terminal cleavage/methylation domain-containing protein
VTRAPGRPGLVLLEVLVALVLLSVVAVGYLQLFGRSHRLAREAGEWSVAVDYAADALERVKLDAPARLPDGTVEALPGGFRRQVTSRPWRAGVELLTVTVVLPDGRRFDVNGLTPTPPPVLVPRPAAPAPDGPR